MGSLQMLMLPFHRKVQKIFNIHCYKNPTHRSFFFGNYRKTIDSSTRPIASLLKGGKGGYAGIANPFDSAIWAGPGGLAPGLTAICGRTG